MNATWIALVQCYAGLFAFALFFMAPGFLLATVLNPCGFRWRSFAEKLLWSVCLSLPLSIQICLVGGRALPHRAVVLVFLLLAIAATAVLLAQARRNPAKRPSQSCRSTQLVLVLTGLLGLYLILAVTDIQIGHRLYVSTVLYDWSVRVPMVAAAMRSGVPPLNGLSALSGQPASLRYFYFWYVVCADVARMLSIPARAGLAASCVWAVWSLLCVFFLCLRYLLRVERRIRQCCAVAFLVLAVMGLDLIPTLALLFARNFHPAAEIEWWHQDRTSSLLASAMYAPHHVAAFACLLTGLLVLTLTLRRDGVAVRPMQTVSAGLFAGVCFASAAGCSILPTMVVAIVCLVWAADLVRQRQFATLSALGGSAVTALLLAHRFLHEVLGTAGAASGSFVSIQWRNAGFVAFYAQKYHLLTQHALVNQAITQAGVLAINLSDLGFFLFVLVHQIRRDSGRKLQPQERAMWAFVVGTSIPYFFLSSVSKASPNDLGVDAGFLLRVLLQMWAVPWVYEMWVRWRSGAGLAGAGASRRRRLGLALAGVCLVVGLAGQAFQAVWQRAYFTLVGTQTLAIQLDMLTTDRLAERLYNIREGYRALDWSPANAAIQYNPIGPMQPALTFYTTHQIAASDLGCGTSFGGDYAACQRLMPSLLALYGNTQAGFDRGKAGNDRQDDAAVQTASSSDALAMCGQLHLTALIAESTDSIWGRKDSWVWTMQPAVANETVRIFRCAER